jgi:tRNA-dihydrouridine synthase
VSIGRGALLNPWIFAQLCKWEDTGDEAEPPSYQQRVQFMHKHFHLLVRQRGERFACLTFRKVANWYCKVLRPGHEAQQQLVRLERVAQFDEIVSRLSHRESVPAFDPAETVISVPSGPMSHW